MYVKCDADDRTSSFFAVAARRSSGAPPHRGAAVRLFDWLALLHKPRTLGQRAKRRPPVISNGEGIKSWPAAIRGFRRAGYRGRRRANDCLRRSEDPCQRGRRTSGRGRRPGKAATGLPAWRWPICSGPSCSTIRPVSTWWPSPGPRRPGSRGSSIFKVPSRPSAHGACTAESAGRYGDLCSVILSDGEIHPQITRISQI